MATQQEARLNLVISAKDEASKIVEEFVNNIRKTFEELNTSLKEAFNPNTLVTAVREAVVGINEELKAINFKPIAEDASRVSKLTTEELLPIEKSLAEIGKSAFVTREEFESAFDSIRKTVSGTTNVFVDFSRTAILQMQRIEQTSQTLNMDLSRTFNNASRSMDETAKSVKKLSESVDFVGLQMAGQMLEDFGHRLGGFFLESIKSAAGFDQEIHNTIASMKSLDPTLKNTGQIYDQLKQKALELGTTGFFSANEIAEGMNVLARQGVKGTQTIIAAIDTVHRVAAANQEDLKETANVVTDIYHEFGDQLKQEFGSNINAAFRSIGDIMTSTLHHARLSMTDFLTTLRYVGPVASKAGWSLRDVGEATALLAQHGIRGSQAGTTLRRMITSLTPATKKAAAEMEKLGIITKDQANQFFTADGKAKPFAQILDILHNSIGKLNPQMQTMAVKTLFTMYAMSGVTAIAGTTKKQFDELTRHFGENGVAAAALKEKQQGLGFQLQHLKATYETFQKSVGDAFRGIVAAVAPAISAILGWFIKLDPGIRKAIVLFGAIVAVAAIVGGAFMSLVGTIGLFVTTLATGETALAAGMAAIGAALPEIGLVVAAIAAVIAVVALLKKAWDSDLGHIREITKTVWDWIVKHFNAAINTVKSAIQDGVNAIKKWWDKLAPDAQKAWKTVQTAFEGFSKFFKPWLDEQKLIWQVAWDAAKVVFKATWEQIKSLIRDAWQVISGVIQLIVHLLSGNWHAAWNDAKQIVSGAIHYILDLLGGLPAQMYKWGSNMMGNFLKGIKSRIGQIKNDILDFASWIKDHLGHFSPAKKGPLSTDDKWMPNMMKMFAQGIEANRPGIQKALGNVMMDVNSKLNIGSTTNQSSQSNVNPINNLVAKIQKVVSSVAGNTVAAGIDSFHTSSFSQYDRVQGHTSNAPTTTSLYDRVLGHNPNRPTELHIHIEGRSAETDRQLVNKIQEQIERSFRTHLPMQVS